MQKKEVNIQEILKRLNISQLNEMQLSASKAIKSSNDVVLLSPTGSGKTLAFLLPLLSNLELKNDNVQVLILAPSRELAIQIEQVFKSLQTGFKSNCCYGGHAMKIERNNLIHPPAVLIGTPGRVADHIRRGSLNIDSIKTIIFDEFDKSLEFGFKNEMEEIIKSLSNLSKRVLTSATKAIDIPEFVGTNSPTVIDFLKESQAPKLTLRTVKAEGQDKLEALFRLFCHLGNTSTLVFCNHRDAVKRISDLLNDQEVVHDTFHGGMKQEDRERSLIKFRNGSHHILITTDLASRGLDIPEIQNIIHYQIATTEDIYTHRNGRTARMHAKGDSYIIMGEKDFLPDYIKEEPINCDVSTSDKLPDFPEWITLYIPFGKKDKINKVDIVGLFFKKGELNKDEMGKIEVLDHSSFVAVKRKIADKLISKLQNQRIKNKKLVLKIAM